MCFACDYTSAFELDPFRAGTSLPSTLTQIPARFAEIGSQRLETRFVTCGACGQGSVGGSAVLGLAGFKGLFQPKCFFDSMIPCLARPQGRAVPWGATKPQSRCQRLFLFPKLLLGEERGESGGEASLSPLWRRWLRGGAGIFQVSIFLGVVMPPGAGLRDAPRPGRTRPLLAPGQGFLSPRIPPLALGIPGFVPKAARWRVCPGNGGAPVPPPRQRSLVLLTYAPCLCQT